MYSFKVKTSSGMKRFFKAYPQLFSKAFTKGTNNSLDMLKKASNKAAPYDLGTLRREIKQIYTARMLVAGTVHSRDYAYLQELTHKTKSGYFFGTFRKKKNAILEIFIKEFRKVLSGK